MTAISQQALQNLLDKQEIHEVLMRYCRAVDRLDEALLRSVYFPDALDDHGMFSGLASDFVTWVMKLHREHFISNIHSISNELVEIHGDVAHSESYFTGFHRFKRGDQEYTRISCGRYIDRFERRDGVWKIAHRLVVNDWGRVDPLSEAIEFQTPGFRSREDPVYRRLPPAA